MDSNLMCYEVINGTRNFCKGFNQEGNHCWFCSENDLTSNSKLKMCTQKGFEKKVSCNYNKSNFEVFKDLEGIPVYYKYDGDKEHQIIGKITSFKVNYYVELFCEVKLKPDIKIAEIEKVLFSTNCKPVIGYKSEDHQNSKILSFYLN